MAGQLVVMNTDGIALTSDSTVTVNGEKRQNSASKLFGFSNEHTIGVMVYGPASMFQTPWETLIQGYKSKLSEPFDTVNEYAEDFLQFLGENEYQDFMAEANELVYAEASLYSLLMKLYKDLTTMKTRLYSEEYMLLPQGEFQKIYLQHAEDYLDNQIQLMDDKDFPIEFTACDYEGLSAKYAEKITKMVFRTFEFHLYRIEWLEKIIHLASVSLIKKFFNKLSGVIFTGYGTNESFPTMCVLSIDGKLNNKIKYHIRNRTISHSTPGAIFPFGERDTLKIFLTGIREEMISSIAPFLKKEVNRLSAILAAELKDHLKAESDSGVIAAELSNALMQIHQQYQKELPHYERKKFSDPIVGFVESLPVTELAYLSESLLKAAILKKKLSKSIEMVSDPVDVAIITKDEGFKWIKKE
ncbi:hypothetical protein [Paenisporosarcina sp. TG-14]|uniref:hypothetical protein n=1 Tax=Paenisporosarcina sp. TG-14 TaxID=1231057 RepID=UPI00030D83C8|nr:hypothetical protein [Paenisporosarcina sp. TG-14]